MKEKKVTNLLINIGKVRDIIARGDYDELRRNHFLLIYWINN